MNKISASDLPDGFGQASVFSKQKPVRSGLQEPGNISNCTRRVKPPRNAAEVVNTEGLIYEGDSYFDASLGLSPTELHALNIGEKYPDLAADAAYYLGL
jgi:hypothetical protein